MDPNVEEHRVTDRLKQQILAQLTPYGQGHVVGFWDDLTTAQRQSLAAEVASFDLAEIDRLYREGTAHADWAALAARAESPPGIRLGDDHPRYDAQAARQAGAAALAAGAVGVLLVAGGQGSRLGFPHPKGMFPIGAISRASLFQIHFEKVLATCQRYGAAVPVYVMTSPATHEETIAFLAEHDRFGLPEQDVTVFCQGTMPAVDAETGKLLLADPGRLFLSPDGHGGIVAALRTSGAVEQMMARGLSELFYFQVDNPLVPVCDPQLIGYHRLAKSEMTTVVVAKASPWDRVGNAVSVDGKLQIIEYIDLPDDAATRRAADGSLEIWAGSVAIHVFDFAFLQRMLDDSEALPLHVSQKQVPTIDTRGEQVEPTEPNALKFERFVFDLVPEARNAIVVERARDEVFGPLKNAPGAASETADWVRQRTLALHRRWLEQAGATLADGVPVEISPLMALDPEQLATRIEPGLHIAEPTYLVPGTDQ